MSHFINSDIMVLMCSSLKKKKKLPFKRSSHCLTVISFHICCLLSLLLFYSPTEVYNSSVALAPGAVKKAADQYERWAHGQSRSGGAPLGLLLVNNSSFTSIM